MQFLSSPSGGRLFPPLSEVRCVASTLDQLILLGGAGLDESCLPLPGRPLEPITPQNEPQRLQALIEVLQEMGDDISQAVEEIMNSSSGNGGGGEDDGTPAASTAATESLIAALYFPSVSALLAALECRAAVCRSLGSVYPDPSSPLAVRQRRMFRRVFLYLSSDPRCALFAEAPNPVMPDALAIEMLIEAGGAGPPMLASTLLLQQHDDTTAEDAGAAAEPSSDVMALPRLHVSLMQAPSRSRADDLDESGTLALLQELDRCGRRFDGFGALLEAVRQARESRTKARRKQRVRREKAEAAGGPSGDQQQQARPEKEEEEHKEFIAVDTAVTPAAAAPPSSDDTAVDELELELPDFAAADDEHARDDAGADRSLSPAAAAAATDSADASSEATTAAPEVSRDASASATTSNSPSIIPTQPLRPALLGSFSAVSYTHLTLPTKRIV